MNWLVELRDVRRIYQGANLTIGLDGINLQIEPGEFTAVMGPSGSGKSTLLNLVAGLDRASSGKVLIDGQDLSKATESELARYRRTKVGFVFQFFNLLANLSVRENVALPAELAGIGRADIAQRTSELLAELEIEGLAKSYPNNLSGGQRQRVAVARALVNRPALVLADEPTGALDSRSGSQVMELLDELNSRGQTILLVTHDVKLATRHGRRVLTLRDGRITDDTRLAARRETTPAELVRLRTEEA